jgi:hypothetical protein
MVRPGDKKHIRDIELTATESKFEIIVGSGNFKIVLSFSLGDAEILRRELDEWIDVGTVVRATKRRLIRYSETKRDDRSTMC